MACTCLCAHVCVRVGGCMCACACMCRCVCMCVNVGGHMSWGIHGDPRTTSVSALFETGSLCWFSAAHTRLAGLHGRRISSLHLPYIQRRHLNYALKLVFHALRDLNSSPHSCTKWTFTHSSISPASVASVSLFIILPIKE